MVKKQPPTSKAKIVHTQWQLVGTVMIIDDEGNALPIGKDRNGQDSNSATLTVPIPRFRGNEVTEAYTNARKACEELLRKFDDEAPADPDH